MSAKHTPGPWDSADVGDWRVACDALGTTSYVAIGPRGGKPVGFAVGHTSSLVNTARMDAEMAANADLMMAAPELLAICQELQESASYWSEYTVPLGIVERLNAAIAKATGGQP